MREPLFHSVAVVPLRAEQIRSNRRGETWSGRANSAADGDILIAHRSFSEEFIRQWVDLSEPPGNNPGLPTTMTRGGAAR